MCEQIEQAAAEIAASFAGAKDGGVVLTFRKAVEGILRKHFAQERAGTRVESQQLPATSQDARPARLIDSVKAIYEAGGNGWDNVENPDGSQQHDMPALLEPHILKFVQCFGPMSPIKIGYLLEQNNI